MGAWYTTRVCIPPTHPGYTTVLPRTPLMHAATQWSEQGGAEASWAQGGE